MTDTTEEIISKQIEIFLSKPLKERIHIGMDMLFMGRKIVESHIKESYPNLSEIELKIEIFKQYYQHEFDKEELQRIIDSIKKYYQNK